MTRLPATHTDQVIGRVLRALSNGLTLQDNIQCTQVVVDDTGNADTEFTVQHNLGKVPTSYVWNIDQNGVVYDSNRASWTDTTMTLKCSAPNAKVYLTIL